MTTDGLSSLDDRARVGARPVRRKRIGRAASGVAVVLLVVAAAVDALSTRVVVVVGDRILEPAATTFVLGPVAAGLGLGGWLLLRSPGRLRSGELGVAAGAVVASALALLVPAHPGLLLVMFAFTLPLWVVVGSWSTFAITAAVVTAAVVLLHLRARRSGAIVVPRSAGSLGAGYLTLAATCALWGSALVSSEDEVVVERGPGGCAVVIDAERLYSDGAVRVLRAASGSPVALAVTSHVGEGLAPTLAGDYGLDFDGQDAHLTLGASRPAGGATVTIPDCR